jgi:hypothetical protein
MVHPPLDREAVLDRLGIAPGKVGRKQPDDPLENLFVRRLEGDADAVDLERVLWGPVAAAGTLTPSA